MKQTVIQNPSWWKRRTGTEKFLTLLFSVSLAIAIALAVALGVVVVDKNNDNSNIARSESVQGPPSLIAENTDEKSSSDEEICFSPECIHTASQLLKNMDNSVEPCDDFYEYACGNFVKNTKIPDEKTSVTVFSIISDKLQIQLRDLLESKDPPKSDSPRHHQIVRDYYKACMNKTLIEEQGVKPMKTILRKLGGWPILDGPTWDEKTFDWVESVFKFRRNGFSIDYFLDFSISVDVKNSTVRIVEFDQASLSLSREYLLKGLSDKIVKAYFEYMVDIAVFLGADRETAVKELGESLDFEMKLANISLSREERRNPLTLYNPMTVSELQKMFPSIQWKTYINNILEPHTRVDDDEILNVNVPSYISGLIDLTNKTPKRIQANYLLWRVAASLVSRLSDDIRKIQLHFSTKVNGIQERESRWKECADTVTGSFGLAVGSMYIKKYFDENAKTNALGMVENLRAQFRKILEEVDWMDEKTRAAAIDKADHMAAHIAYPPELRDDKKLTDFYEKLTVSPDAFLESYANYTRFVTDFALSKLRTPYNKSDWIYHGRPAIVNAFYAPLENSIQFPAGILQGVFFNANRPQYMNYGAIGFVIGHEITHGFDDQGRQYNKDGNLVDWWDESTKEKYLEKAKCIIDQYSGFLVKEINTTLNGLNTQGENIADNGGLKEAYHAYLKWVEKNGPERKLPGLDLTPQQLFWLSAANTWCAVYRPESLKMKVVVDSHSPGRFRVNGPMGNMVEFSKDFNCPLGSKMNPEHKCGVW